MTAIDILTHASKHHAKGFFLMIEGSRIDMAAHSNDPAANVHEILEYQNTIDFVKKYVGSRDDTVMISVSDHETGGLALGLQLTEQYPEYLWKPEALVNVKNSTFKIADFLIRYKLSGNIEFIKGTVLKSWLDITDATKEELSFFDGKKNLGQLDFFMGSLVSRRAQIGWSTHGHTGVDVNIYAKGLNAHKLAGSHENTEIGSFISEFLGLDVDVPTGILAK